MIDSILSAFQPSKPNSKVLIMVENDRIGGKVPAWVTPDKGKHSTTETILSQALQADSPTSATALSYAPTNTGQSSDTKEFTFADLLDMINPLQHIPLLNQGYRAMTGDEIRPIGKIMGGALYGGALGAAGGLVDTIVTAKTGKDIASHIINSSPSTSKPTINPIEENTILALSDLKTDPFKSLNS